MSTVLVIAGHDPSGGAGIQADARVIESFGVAAATVPTALTVQNSLGVTAVHAVQPEIIKAQLEALFDDAGAFDAVKVGMLADAEQASLIAEVLRRRNATNVVLDPVLASSAGFAFSDAAAVDSLLRELLPVTTLITPNTGELERLGGLGPLASVHVLEKGGHAGGDESVDTLHMTDGRKISFRAKRVDVDAHGTGCFLSSAIAANLALGYPLEQAVGVAKRATSSALQQVVRFGSGRGYPGVASARDLKGRLKGIYVVTDDTLRPERSHVDIAAAALDAGVRVVQLRDKRTPFSKLVRVAHDLRILTRRHDALFIVNDRVDLARITAADGVHLGPDDMHPADARRILGPHALIGASVSSVEEAEKYAAHASYFGVGAIFGTATKGDAGEAIGPAKIAEIKSRFPEHPVVAIGGINAGNVSQVFAAGADAAAVVSAIVAADDVAAAARELVELARAAAPTP